MNEQILLSIITSVHEPDPVSFQRTVRSVMDVMQDNWESIEPGKSLASGFSDADPEAILAWNKRMAELVAMNDVAALIDNKAPVTEARLASPLTKIQTEWMDRQVSTADFG